jgi:hypothetical protein
VEEILTGNPTHAATRGWFATLLRVAAISLVLLAAISLATGGVRWSLGFIRVSATDPSRLLLEAAAVWLIAEVSGVRDRRRLSIPVAIAALLLASIADSTPRRVGDGLEYVAMTLNLSHGRSPALSPLEQQSLLSEIARLPGFDRATVDTPVPGRDGKADFRHFWLYPLVVSPVAALTRWGGAHVNHAFTSVNILLIGGLVWLLARRGYTAGAAMLVAGPILWWVDKAHAEVFIFVAIAFAVLLVDTWPAVALVAAGLAAAQNPAAGAVLAVCLACVLILHRTRRVPWAAAIAALVIAASAPAYYQWHLGMWSPLSSTVHTDLPGLRAFVTPVIDPNLGLLPYAPVLIVAAFLGLKDTSRLVRLAIAVASLLLLGAFAISGNVNHGGSPGMSRYALWLLALCTPMVAAGCEAWRARHRATWQAAVTISIAFSLVAFRPALADRAGDSPNWLAKEIWARWPALDSPLPEVFAERVSGLDGSALVPVGITGCTKLLIAGNGVEARWPFPCAPRNTPASCAAAGALCYVNNGLFADVPRQPAFNSDDSLTHAWTVKDMARFDRILARLGARPQFVRLIDRGGRIAAVENLDVSYMVEGAGGTAAWVSMRAPGEAASIRLDVPARSALELLEPSDFSASGISIELSPGLHEVPLLESRPIIVLVSDR